MNINNKTVKFTVKLGVILAIMLIFTPSAFAKNDNPRVLPPNGNAYGMSYGEWSAKWWMWTYSMPVDHHPLYDTANCRTGQLGKVWFLGGTFTATSFPGSAVGNFDRSCTVPTGTALFFPVINSSAATLEGDGSGNAALRAKAKFYQDHAKELYAEIDGMPVENLQRYRVQSPLFQYGPLPLNNIPCNNGFAAPGVVCSDANDPRNLAGKTSDIVADGVFLLLPPLRDGKHEIKFGGKSIQSVSNGDPIDFTFILDGTYHITVKPGKKEHD